jgi:hypothetical protein
MPKTNGDCYIKFRKGNAKVYNPRKGSKKEQLRQLLAEKTEDSKLALRRCDIRDAMAELLDGRDLAHSRNIASAMLTTAAKDGEIRVMRESYSPR